VEVVQEVMHVAARRGRRDAAAALADALLALFPGLLSVTPAVVSRACEMFRGHPDLSVRDALHAATMLENGIDTIVTADRHFDGLDGLRRIDPSRAGRLRPPAR
jgi:predicted nucleic acid-binding protein